MGQDKYRLKVWNSGKTTVTNVNVNFDEADAPMIMDEGKQPYDELEPNKNYELVLLTHYGTASKFHVTTRWIDSSGKECSKCQMADL